MELEKKTLEKDKAPHQLRNRSFYHFKL